MTQDLLNAKFVELDTNPPVFSIAQDTWISSGPILLVFTTPAGATYYEIEISTKEDFSELLEGFPKKLPVNAFLFEPTDARTYYARVRANTTRKGEYSPTLRFHALQGVVRVYCAQSETNCLEGEGYGTKDMPFKNIAYAMEKAELFGIREVHVASRGGSAVYNNNKSFWVFRIA